MEYCYVKFKAKDSASLQRTIDFFSLVKVAKEKLERDLEYIPDENKLTEFLSEEERSYFWHPTEAQIQEWNEFWFSTPTEIRHSPQMPLPPWDIESMYDALWSGEYELITIEKHALNYHLNFYPYAAPYGSTDSMVALVECFGHTVLGVEDGHGTSYRKYVKPNRWKPKNQRI